MGTSPQYVFVEVVYFRTGIEGNQWQLTTIPFPHVVQVTITWTTHDAGGLTELDVKMANFCDAAASP